MSNDTDFDHVKRWSYSGGPGCPRGVMEMSDVLYIARAGSDSCYIGFHDEDEVDAFKAHKGFSDEWKMVDRRVHSTPTP